MSALITLDREIDVPAFKGHLVDAHMYLKTLARKSGINQTQLAEFARGAAGLPIEQVQAIEKALGIEGAFTDTPQTSGEEYRAAVADEREPVAAAETTELDTPAVSSSPEQDIAAVLVVTPEAIEDVAAEIKTEPRAVIEDHAMQLFALDAVPKDDYDALQRELDAARERIAEMLRLAAETPIGRFQGPGAYGVQLTAHEWLDARDAVAEVAKVGFDQPGTGHFEIAEQLLRRGYVDLVAVLNEVR